MTYSPFFVTGVPKSGTTWLGKLLDAHPEISCKGEACVHAFIKSLIRISNEYNELLASRVGQFSESNDFPPMKAPEVHAVARYFIEQRLGVVADPGKASLKLVGEKDPYHIMNLPFLQDLFPEGKVIHIIRDGRSVVVSAWHHNLRITPGVMKTAGFDAFMDEAAGRWGTIIRRAHETAHLLGNHYLEVRYEDLIADASGQLSKILAHLGADSDDAVVQACIEAASFEKLSQGRSQGQEDAQSFFRKGVADDWKNHMTPAQIQRFNARSGGMLEELGYLG
ncbi:MAG TPA: sulfotransferase [Holophagaceae bacterium]|jgi:hypothetical protein|nr:sulfotransferase [Holophagaceae bacterium]